MNTLRNMPPDKGDDLIYHEMTDRISQDYMTFFKRKILPEIDGFKSGRIRELRVLMAVDTLGSGTTSRSVASVLRYDPATVSRAVKTLASYRLVGLSAEEKDSRLIPLNLTPLGQGLVDQFKVLCRDAIGGVDENTGKPLSGSERRLIMQALEILQDRAANLAGS